MCSTGIVSFLFFLLTVSAFEMDTQIMRYLSTATQWLTINDSVMGGRSTCTVENEGGVMIFKGRVSVENNGGFASIRLRAIELDLQEFDGLFVDSACSCEALSVGPTFCFTVKDLWCSQTQVNYKSRLANVGFGGSVKEFKRTLLPFDEMIPEYRGRRVQREDGGSGVRRGEVREIGFMALKPMVGAFELRIGAIGAYKKNKSSDEAR